MGEGKKNYSVIEILIVSGFSILVILGAIASQKEFRKPLPLIEITPPKKVMPKVEEWQIVPSCQKDSPKEIESSVKKILNSHWQNVSPFKTATLNHLKVTGSVSFSSQDSGSFQVSGPAIFNKSVTVLGSVSAREIAMTSDSRVKHHIQDLNVPLEKLLRVHGRSYYKKGDDRLNFGFIAQEVREIFPELVHEIAPNSSNSNESPLLGISYYGFIPLLLEGLRELSHKLSELEKDEHLQKNLAELESENRALMERLERLEVRFSQNKLDDPSSTHSTGVR